MTRFIDVNDRMQTGYRYECVARVGTGFAEGFKPHVTPKEMLKMGVFEGKYCNDCTLELPSDWFEGAKISDKPDPTLNYFGLKSRQPLTVWREKGWIYGPDPRGWFQWYCRYFMGRRISEVDQFQIRRWKAFGPRHIGGIRSNCEPMNLDCRRRQRQALLQWAYDPFI